MTRPTTLPPSNPSRRDSLRRLAAVPLAAGIAAAAPRTWAQSAPMPVRVGYISDFHGCSLYAIANYLNLWAKHGLVPDIKAFTNGPIEIQALGAGDLDFGYIGPGALWLPMTGKAKVIAINVVGFSDRVIGQASIKSMQDLRGKTVAVPEGTSGDMLLRLALRKAGMTINDVKRVPMDPTTIVTAFISGQVDGAGIWYPHVATIKGRVPATVELFGNKDALPENSFPSSYVMRNELSDASHARMVDAMIRVLKEANDFRHKNLAQAVDLAAAMIKAPRASLETESQLANYYTSNELSKLSQDGTVGNWLKGMNDMFKGFGRVPEVVDPAGYYLGARYAAVR